MTHTHTHTLSLTHTHTKRERERERADTPREAPVHRGETLVNPPELSSFRTVADALLWLPVPAPDNP